MTEPLAQLPVLLFAAMTAGFMLVLGYASIEDALRRR
jgi:hypothetical protein